MLTIPLWLKSSLDLKPTTNTKMQNGKASYLECFKPLLLKRLLTGCALQGLQQLTGVSFIFHYDASFFRNSGIDNPWVISMITSVVNVLSTLPRAIFGGEMGKKTAAHVWRCCQTANKVLIAFACFTIFFFPSIWGPLGGYRRDLPAKARAKRRSMITATNWNIDPRIPTINIATTSFAWSLPSGYEGEGD
ncbi:hypothetical protein GJ744_011544 [Endocarpon pusillum]|uniref:Major facilitator superfamily (MFS) profile domain-containing protein n=1 Tax=Endocarpon pusillum TaxID=364733 RepID=A0A8H7AF12_9EURO|nr:hypothetical protein GJ744_011544 [Endocarpon pusillum]